jgi:hypothetical protein
MPDALIPHKACKLAFGLQSGLGVAAAADIMFPVHEDTTGPNWGKNYSFFQYSDGHYDKRHYYSEGEWAEGDISFPLLPGVLSGDFYDWILGRTSDATYAQGYYATIYRDLGNIIERFVDVKVKSGSIAVPAGMATMKLSVVGLQTPEEVGAFSGTIYTAKPYTYDEATIELALGAGSYGTPDPTLASEVYTSNHTLEFDNMLEDPKEMIVLNGETTPLALPNNAKPEWTGNFDRIFANPDIYRDFLNGREGQYKLTLTHVTGAVATIAFPRIVWTEHAMNVPSSGIVRTSGIPFTALGSVDGLTAACTISETL